MNVFAIQENRWHSEKYVTFRNVCDIREYIWHSGIYLTFGATCDIQGYMWHWSIQQGALYKLPETMIFFNEIFKNSMSLGFTRKICCCLWFRTVTKHWCKHWNISNSPPLFVSFTFDWFSSNKYKTRYNNKLLYTL